MEIVEENPQDIATDMEIVEEKKESKLIKGQCNISNNNQFSSTGQSNINNTFSSHGQSNISNSYQF